MVTISDLGEKVSDARRSVTRLVYERRYGVDTTDTADLDEFGLDADGRLPYAPSNWRVLARVLPRNSISSEDVFVDLGCGKGRVVLQAAMRYPFARVIGVELAPPLAEVARQNVERNRARLTCRDVEIVNADATEYQIPDDVTVAFLYSPFLGPIFAQVAANLTASLDRRPRPLRVLYKNPVEHEALMRTGRFRVAGEFRRPAARLFGRPDPGVTRTYETV